MKTKTTTTNQENTMTTATATKPVRFNKHHVTDGVNKARCFYSLDNRTDQRPCVTIYAKDFNSGLGRMFANDYKNDTDSQTDYFDEGRVVLFEDHAQYAAARTRAESLRN